MGSDRPSSRKRYEKIMKLNFTVFLLFSVLINLLTRFDVEQIARRRGTLALVLYGATVVAMLGALLVAAGLCLGSMARLAPDWADRSAGPEEAAVDSADRPAPDRGASHD